MAFPKKHLHEDEEIVLDRHPSAVTFAAPVLVALAAVVVLLWRLLAVDLHGIPGTITAWAPVAVIGLAALWFLKRWTQWSTTSFVVTTDRLIFRSGVLGKAGKEIPLERINDISYKQSIWERLIRSGDLLIESGGEQGQERFANVSDPFHMQNQIYRQIERTKARDMDRMAGRRQLSVPEQIEKLDALRQQGVLTQAEFDAKKTQLLGLDS
jgi:uncharacterized membrane protein YdbT with pleckstrin-like domain